MAAAMTEAVAQESLKYQHQQEHGTKSHRKCSPPSSPKDQQLLDSELLPVENLSAADANIEVFDANTAVDNSDATAIISPDDSVGSKVAVDSNIDASLAVPVNAGVCVKILRLSNKSRRNPSDSSKKPLLKLSIHRRSAQSAPLKDGPNRYEGVDLELAGPSKGRESASDFLLNTEQIGMTEREGSHVSSCTDDADEDFLDFDERKESEAKRCATLAAGLTQVKISFLSTKSRTELV